MTADVAAELDALIEAARQEAYAIADACASRTRHDRVKARKAAEDRRDKRDAFLRRWG